MWGQRMRLRPVAHRGCARRVRVSGWVTSMEGRPPGRSGCNSCCTLGLLPTRAGAGDTRPRVRDRCALWQPGIRAGATLHCLAVPQRSSARQRAIELHLVIFFALEPDYLVDDLALLEDQQGRDRTNAVLS